MYDDIIQNIAYSLATDGLNVSFIGMLLNFCGIYAIDFCGFLGITIGVKFLKDSFK